MLFFLNLPIGSQVQLVIIFLMKKYTHCHRHFTIKSMKINYINFFFDYLRKYTCISFSINIIKTRCGPLVIVLTN